MKTAGALARQLLCQMEKDRTCCHALMWMGNFESPPDIDEISKIEFLGTARNGGHTESQNGQEAQTRPPS